MHHLRSIMSILFTLAVIISITYTCCITLRCHGAILLNIPPKLAASLLLLLIVSRHLPLKVIDVHIFDLLLSILDMVHFRYHLMWQDLVVGKLRKLDLSSNVASSISLVSMIIIVRQMSILAE
jgi:hypothetical protein